MRDRSVVNVNDLREMAAENKHCSEAARHFEQVRAYAINGLAELSPHHRERFLTLVAWLAGAIGTLTVSPAFARTGS